MTETRIYKARFIGQGVAVDSCVAVRRPQTWHSKQSGIAWGCRTIIDITDAHPDPESALLALLTEEQARVDLHLERVGMIRAKLEGLT